MSASNWRTTQLSWYGGDVLIQDLELTQFINNRNISSIKYAGDYGGLADVLGFEDYEDNYDMCIYIVNSPFVFNDVVQCCVKELQAINPGGVLYVAVNKFLAVAESNNSVTEESYDKCILEYMRSTIPYPLIQYHSGELDGGRKLNWAHPITRFYFQNANT